MPDSPHDDCGAPMSISGTASHLGVSVETLRYYEAEGLIAPDRDEQGRRLYAQRDLDALHVIHTLRRAGFSMSDISRLIAVKEDLPRDELIDRARAVLQGFRADVAARQRALRDSRALIDRWLADLDEAQRT